MITFLILLVVVGVAMYLVENYIPMSEPFKIVFRVVVVLILIIYLLNLFNVVNIPMK